MTATRKLGRRQVDVLRAAAAGNLVRLDSGTWSAASTACTQAAESVAKRELLAPVNRMVEYTFGVADGKPGTRMGLSTEGERVLQEWELANPEPVVARERRAAAIKALAAKPGPITGDDLLRLAANDERLDDDAFTTLAPALRGEQPNLPTGNEPGCSDCGHGIGDHEVVMDDLGERVECRAPGCRCRISGRPPDLP